MSWAEILHTTPIDWLLEEEHPPVRYWALRDLLDLPGDDPEVQRAEAAIPAFAPVSQLLAEQKASGYWVQRDYYLPKNYGTFWTLTLLADLGLTAENEPIRRACEFIFTFQREHGAFCRRRRVAGRGIVWDKQPGPCTHARVVRFLIQFGYAGDPRTRAGIDWILGAQRDDGMWHCHPTGGRGCLRATLDVLRVAALDPRMARHPAVDRGAAIVNDLLLEPGMHRYHVGTAWTDLSYPHFGYGVVTALDALARLGYTLAEPKVAAAMDYVLSRQLPGGAWPLDHSPHRPPFDFGTPGEPNKWLTLDALRAIKLLHGGD